MTQRTPKKRMNNKMPNTKKQHYIPQFYLKNFSHDQNHIHVYDKKIGEKGEFRYQTTTDIAHENHFYTYRTKKGTNENLEDFFCQFEGDAAAIIEKVYRTHQITNEEKEKLALFVAFIYTRTPSFKARTEEMHTAMGETILRKMIKMAPKEWLRKFYKEKLGKAITDKKLDDFIDFATNPKRSKVEYTYPNEYWIKVMLEMGAKTAPIFFGMNWLFLFTDKPYAFITSDNPFLLVPPDHYDKFWGYGLATTNARKIVPLKSDMCLLMGDLSEKPFVNFASTDKGFFKQVNEHLILECKRFCFSSDRGKLQKLVKTFKPYNIPKVKRIRVD